MTAPMPGPVALLQDPMEWQKKKQQEEQARTQSRQAIYNNVPMADQLINPEQNYTNIQRSVADTSASAAQGVVGALQTKQRNLAELQQKQFQQQQQQALLDLQNQQEKFYSDLKAQYAGQFNQQYNEQAAQWNAYNTPGSPYSGYLTGVQYTGQAAQIAQYARQAGFPESAIPTAVAIAMAESSGRANARNTANANGSTDFGLMQINSVHSGLLQKYNWADPAQNMKMAFEVWKGAGGSFTPWVTYNNGAYKQFNNIGVTAANAIQPANIQPFMVQTSSGLRSAVTSKAQNYLGLPYVWGGTDLSKGVDCSGLVQSVYKQFGIKLPRTADEQAHSGVKTSISNLMPGDLVAWQGGYRGPNYVGHIAIYMGNGRILEAQQDGVPVHIRNLGKNENVFGVHLTNLDRGPNGYPR